MLLKEMLVRTKNPSSLKDFGRDAGLDEGLSVMDIAGRIADSLLAEMPERMLILRDDDIAFFENSLAKTKPFVPAKANYANADRIRYLDYGAAIDKEMHFVIPEDVKETYQKINTLQWQDKRRKISWLYECMSLIPSLYAIINVKDLCSLYRKRHGFQETDKEIMTMLQQLLDRREDCPVYLEGEDLVVNGLKETGQEEKIRRLHENMPAGFPSYSEMKDILDNRYPAKEKTYQQLKTYFLHQIRVHEDFIDALMEAVYQFIATGNTFSDTLKMIRNEQIPISKDDEKELEEYMTRAWDHTRMLMCNGRRPCEIMPGNTYIFQQ